MEEAGENFPDLAPQGRLSKFSLARLCLLLVVLFTIIFIHQELLGEAAIFRVYLVLCASFMFSLINVSLWSQTLRVRLYIPSQLLYDLLLTSYLVYLTGINESIFLFLYLFNIVFASAVYQLTGALIVAGISGIFYAFIYYVNLESDLSAAFYGLAYNEFLLLLTALLCGQLMDELKRQGALLRRQGHNIARLELLNDRLLNSIPAGIITVDENEFVLNINHTALTLLELEHMAERRIKYYELIPELKGIIPAWRQMTEAQRLRFTFKQGSSSSKQFSFDLVALKGPDKGAERDLRHILVFQDVSKMLELEKKLEFESRLAATGELAAGIAHEIRNPLASISASIEMLSMNLEIVNEQDRKLFNIALREISRLKNLITDFLEFAKPRNEQADDFSLRDAVLEVSEAITGSAQGAANVEFSVDVAPGVLIHANRERMKQVFFNLFLNSMEAAGSAGVRIAVRSSNEQPGFVRINVLDNGPGIPSGLMSKIFDPFFTTKPKGTGLGLASVARIMKAAKSEIRVVPSQNGAHFLLIIPASSMIELAGTAS